MLPYLGPHMLRVGRVLRQPGGHLLLTGAAGSGRRSAARLAAFLATARLVEARLSAFGPNHICRPAADDGHVQHGLIPMTVRWCWPLQVDAAGGASSATAVSDKIVSAVFRAGIQNAKTVILGSLPFNSNSMSWLATLATMVANEGDVSSCIPAVEHKRVSRHVLHYMTYVVLRYLCGVLLKLMRMGTLPGFGGNGAAVRPCATQGGAVGSIPAAAARQPAHCDGSDNQRWQ